MGEGNLKNREALMTAPYQKVLTDGQFKALKRYMVAAATAYAFIMIGVLTVIFTSDASDDTTSGYGVAAYPSPTTDGHNKAMERIAPEAAMRVPVPEVDELGEAPMWPGGLASSLNENAWDFTKPETIPGFGPIVEHTTTPDGQRLTARPNPDSNR